MQRRRPRRSIRSIIGAQGVIAPQDVYERHELVEKLKAFLIEDLAGEAFQFAAGKVKEERN